MGVWCCGSSPGWPTRVEPPKDGCGGKEWGSARDTKGTEVASPMGDASALKRRLGVGCMGLHVKHGATAGVVAYNNSRTGAPARVRGCEPVVARPTTCWRARHISDGGGRR